MIVDIHGQYLSRCGLSDAARAAIQQGNARRVYPALDRRLTAMGR